MRGDAERTLAERRRRAMMRHASSPSIRLNMTPMIDVVFLLLIYFVLVADFAKPERLAPLDVAQSEEGASDPFALPEVPSVLTIASSGEERDAFGVRTEQPVFAVPGDFASVSSRALESLGARHPIVVRTDPSTRWEHAVVAYRTLRDVGFERVDLVYEELTP